MIEIRQHILDPEKQRSFIEESCKNRVLDRYGEKPHHIITERLNKELEIVNIFPSKYVLATGIASKIKQCGYLHNVRGTAGSSFVAYLLGITETNPIEPHYYCNNCKHTEFVDKECYTGFDLSIKPLRKVCPICGNHMEGDGHGIPFETFADKEPDFNFNIADEITDDVIGYIQETFGNDKVFYAGLENGGRRPDKIMIFPWDDDVSEITEAEDRGGRLLTTVVDYHELECRGFMGIGILPFKMLSILKRLEEMTETRAKEIDIAEVDIQSFFESGDYLISQNAFSNRITKDIVSFVKPRSFSHLLKMYGFCHSTGVWEDNGRDLIKEGRALTDIIAFREDIYDYMIRQGVPPMIACTIMEKSRKGRLKRGGFSSDEVVAMMSNSIPAWYIESLGKIDYAFPKAHGVEYVTNYLRLIWYQTHYPEEFKSAALGSAQRWLD